MLHSPAPPAEGPFERSRSLPLPERPRRLSELLLLHLRRGSTDWHIAQASSSAAGASSASMDMRQNEHPHARMTAFASKPSHAHQQHQPPLLPSAARRNSKSQVHAIDSEVYSSLEQLLRPGCDCSNSSSSGTGLHANDDLTLPAPPPLRVKESEDTTTPTCFICMGKFTAKQGSIPIPCSQCKDAPVHLRCIYEWRNANENASCPLCRSELRAFDYVPRDALCTHALFMYSARKSFVTRPVGKEMGMVRCYVRIVGVSSALTRRTPVRYEMFLQAPTTRKYPAVPLPPTGLDTPAGDAFLLSARRTSGFALRSELKVSLHRACERGAKETLASVRAGSWLGLDYTVNAMPKSLTPSPSGLKDDMAELASVRFEQNRLGSGQGPRRITVCLPRVTPDPDAFDPWPPQQLSSSSEQQSSLEDDGEFSEDDVLEDEDLGGEMYKTEEHVPSSKKDSLRNMMDDDDDAGFIFARNRKPYYLDSIAAFSLDFFGRVTLPSNKNFLLAQADYYSAAVASEALESEGENGNSADSNMLVFGRVATKGQEGAEADVYTLDFQYPLSPVQAFGIALASCDRKLGCA